MRKYFKDNQKYFNYINKHMREIDIIEVKPIKKSIRMTYRKKSPEEIEREVQQLELDVQDSIEIGDYKFIAVNGGMGVVEK